VYLALALICLLLPYCLMPVVLYRSAHINALIVVFCDLCIQIQKDHFSG